MSAQARPILIGLVVALALLVSTLAVRDRLADHSAIAAITDPTEQRSAGAAALALVAVPPASVGYDIRFAAGRDGLRAETDRTRRTITVYLRRGDLPHVVAHDIAHEVGHAVDLERMTTAARNAFLSARGVADAAWFTASTDDYGTGAGDFAEVFALCHAASDDFRSRLAPRPEQPCELLPAEAR